MNLTLHQPKLIVDKLITDYQDELFRYAYFRTGSADDARDVVQEVFLHLYKAFRKSGEIENVRAYLYKSVSNGCITLIHERSKFTEMNQAHENIAEENVESTNDFKNIARLLSKIPAEQAEVIRLKVMEEMKFTEIAELLSEPLTTVKSRFKYGIDKLKEIIKSKEMYYELL